jgi:hypothetical protein
VIFFEILFSICIQVFWCLWFCLMDESGREIIDGLEFDPDLSSNEYV